MKIKDWLKGRGIVWILEGLDRDTLRRKLVARILYRKIVEYMEGKNMGKKSWKTTLAGVSSILAALAGLAKGVSDGDYSIIGASISGIVAGIGLIMARDNDKSSEQVGAK